MWWRVKEEFNTCRVRIRKGHIAEMHQSGSVWAFYRTFKTKKPTLVLTVSGGGIAEELIRRAIAYEWIVPMSSRIEPDFEEAIKLTVCKEFDVGENKIPIGTKVTYVPGSTRMKGIGQWQFVRPYGCSIAVTADVVPLNIHIAQAIQTGCLWVGEPMVVEGTTVWVQLDHDPFEGLVWCR